MKVSLSWLKELVDYNLTPQKLADQLSLRSIGIRAVSDDYIELDLTYNRGDLLSLRGVAREVAALTGSKKTFEDLPFPKYNLPQTPVKVENSKLCPLYTVAKIENLKVEDSDETWVKKLSESGQRSINNIADVTNLIMIEFGQPMHAFDALKVEESLVVRAAKTGEKLTTLDGKIRHLDKEDLLIADTQKPLGLAGVMGGKNSEVSSQTTTILLEAAIFDPVVNRKTAKRHGLFSEASKRFQHGLTKTNLLQALTAAIKMYENIGGKLTALTLVGDLEEKLKTINLTQEKINSLLGIAIPQDKVEASLKSLGFSLESTKVIPPYWRLDINIEEDLIEEVARMYGYEKIEGVPLPEEKIPPLDQTLPNFVYNLKLKLKEAGLIEVETYSFYSTAILETLGVPKGHLIKIANPISSETEYLRNHLWPNLVEVVGKNIKAGYKDIGIFEIGKVYWPEEGQPKENYRLSIALMNGSDNPLAELYQLAQSLNLPIKTMHFPPHLFHPKRKLDGMAEVHLRLLNKLGIEKRVAVLEILLDF